MTHNSDSPEEVPIRDVVTDPTQKYFLKRHLNFPVDVPVRRSDPQVAARLRDILRVEEADRDQLRAEDERFPLATYVEEKPDEKVRLLKEILGESVDIQISPDDDSKIRIGNTLDFDAVALRRIPPSDREAIIRATHLPQGEARDAAMKDLIGKKRIRTPELAQAGQTHLISMLKGEMRDKLQRLFDSDQETIEGKYRAWDILNKIDDNQSQEVQTREKRRQTSVLGLAMALEPSDLRDLVECFEFAELGVGELVDAQAQALMQERLEKESTGARLEAKKSKVARLTRTISDRECEVAPLQARLEEDIEPEERKQIIAKIEKLTLRLPGMREALAGAQKGVAELTEEMEEEKRQAAAASAENDSDEDLVKPSDGDKKSAKDAVFQKLEKDTSFRDKLVRDLTEKFEQYVAAVAATGNASGVADVAFKKDAIFPDTQAVVDAYSKLRFGSDRAAGYHSLKHFDEIEQGHKAAQDFGDPIKNKVGNYHLSARQTVQEANCVNATVGQSGGESHHFKGRPCTAIVWSARGRAGLATYFNI